MNKQQKIDQILALMNGKVSPADIEPRLVIHFEIGLISPLIRAMRFLIL